MEGDDNGRNAMRFFGDAFMKADKALADRDWLLAALKAMVAAMEQVVDGYANDRSSREALAAARRVIERAEGG